MDDIICAPATSPFNSALALIRISGDGTEELSRKIFSMPDAITDRKPVYGSILDKGGQIIDDVLLTYFKGPKSFTGDDTVEISCHGNPLIVQKIITLVTSFDDARLAEPGEFSRIAFLNGKIDLTEAQAINAIIQAKSDWEISASIEQMHGSLKNAVVELKDELILLKANIEAAIDFSQEDIEFVSYETAIEQASAVLRRVEDVHARCRTSEKLSHGINVAIVGKPNVGKSSILNMIINAERAIVSDIPGTTRDIIRESVQIGGVHVNFIDTAGIRESDDLIEQIGITRSKEELEKAAIVIAVFDNSTGILEEDRRLLEVLPSEKTIPLINKTDLETNADFSLLNNYCSTDAIAFSALKGKGFQELESRLAEKVKAGVGSVESNFIADIRIVTLLAKASEFVKVLIALLQDGEPEEIVAFQINEVIRTLGEITGEISDDEILGSIFSRFCIGK